MAMGMLMNWLPSMLFLPLHIPAPPMTSYTINARVGY